MRRRAGAASSHLDGAGAKNTSVDMPDSLSDMINRGSARLAVGAVKGKLMPKKNTQAGDPTVMGAKPRRTPVKVDAGSSERMGACCKISAKMPTVDPAAGATMANARIIPSTMGARQGMDKAASDSLR
jgi:hypothetical protein